MFRVRCYFITNNHDVMNVISEYLDRKATDFKWLILLLFGLILISMCEECQGQSDTIQYRNVQYPVPQENLLGLIEQVTKLINQDQQGSKPLRTYKAFSKLQGIIEDIRKSEILTEEDKSKMINYILSTKL